MIATPAGERPIELLQLGDLVSTVAGASKDVKWIGRWQAEKPRDGNWNRSDVPIKVARGALDGSLPHRDLYITDMHCLFIDGSLIPAIDLVNGVSIVKELPPDAEELEYYHVELEDHDAVISNGAASESLRVAAGDRQRFGNGAEYLNLYGLEPSAAPAFAPLSANNTRSKALLSSLRTMVAPIYDMRAPHEIVRSRLAGLAVCSTV